MYIHRGRLRFSELSMIDSRIFTFRKTTLAFLTYASNKLETNLKREFIEKIRRKNT